MTAPILTSHACGRCSSVIPPLEVHLRVTVHLATGAKTVQRYCVACCADPSMAVLFADVCNNPVKMIEVFAVYR